MTTENPQHTPDPQLTRRQLMHKVGATGVAAGGVYAAGDQFGYDPTDSAEAIPILPVLALAGGAVVGGAVTYLGIKHSQPSRRKIQNARAKELHSRVFRDAVELQSRAQSHHETFQNIDKFIRDHIRQNVSWQIDQCVAEGKTKSETVAEVKSEIDKTASGFLEQHYQEWNEINFQLGYAHDALASQSGIQITDVFDLRKNGETGPHSDLSNQMKDYYNGSDSSRTISLPNGTSIDVFYYFGAEKSGGGLYNRSPAPRHHQDSTAGLPQMVAEPVDSTEQSTVIVFDVREWSEVTKDLNTVAQEEKNNAANLVDQLYDPLKNGEIDDSGEIQSARNLKKLAEDADNYNEAAAAYRSINMPESQTNVMIEVLGAKIEGFLFSSIGTRELPTDEKVMPREEPGSIEIAGAIRDTGPWYGPQEPQNTNVDITLVDQDGNPLELATVNVHAPESWATDEFDLAATADTDGNVSLVVDGRFNHTNITIEFEGNQYITTIAHGGSDHSETITFQAGTNDTIDKTPLWDRSGATDGTQLVTGEITSPFVITQTGDDSDTITFSNRELIDPSPDSDPQKTYDRLKAAYKQEQESSDEVDKLIDEALLGGGGDGSGGGLFGFLPDLRYLGLLAGGGIATVFGFNVARNAGDEN